jgi:uncharacterized protein (DUF2252 family)
MSLKMKVVTKEEKFQKGKDLRKKCSRSKHAEWSDSLRSIDPLRLLENSNIDRISDLVAIRYKRMSESPFKFFRGSAIIQARDLANSPKSGINIQVCGDCHLMNFGGFATPERNLVFDINDFDETFFGPWEWDVKRLAVSFVLTSRELGFSDRFAKDTVREVTSSYRTRLLEFSKMTYLQRWYAKITIEDLQKFFHKSNDTLNRLRKIQTLATAKTSETLFPKITSFKDGHPRIEDNPPLIYHYRKIPQAFKSQNSLLNSYKKTLQDDRRKLLEKYNLEDSVIKVVGIGSVGTRCFVVLFYADGSEPLFLQIKEARRSVIEKSQGKSIYDHQGYRIVHGQHLMQAASDIFLGWFRSDTGRDYYVRQLRDMKISPKFETFKQRTLLDYATICGWALARAHSKGGEASMISGYLGTSEKFDEALVKYATDYANQVELDFKAFKGAIASERFNIQLREERLLEFEI